MRRFPPAVLAAVFWCAATAQTGMIGTVAGGALPVNIPGTSAKLGMTAGIAVDPHGNLLLTDDNLVLRLDGVTGILTLVAGNGIAGYSGDNGPAASAQMNSPAGVALDSSGNLYIEDYSNVVTRKVTNGVIATVAGLGAGALAIDPAGNLYIADDGNRVRQFSNGAITLTAGTGTAGYSGDNGPATSAELSSPQGIAVDSSGSLYPTQPSGSWTSTDASTNRAARSAISSWPWARRRAYSSGLGAWKPPCPW